MSILGPAERRRLERNQTSRIAAVSPVVLRQKRAIPRAIMYSDWLASGIVVVATVAAVCLSVLVHYEGLLFTSRRLATLGLLRRTKVLYGIGSVLILHVFEIWILGLTLWLLLQLPACDSLGPTPQHLLDALYFSAVTYTTVGFGDLAPIGPNRFLAGTEALTVVSCSSPGRLRSPTWRWSVSGATVKLSGGRHRDAKSARAAACVPEPPAAGAV